MARTPRNPGFAGLTYEQRRANREAGLSGQPWPYPIPTSQNNNAAATAGPAPTAPTLPPAPANMAPPAPPAPAAAAPPAAPAAPPQPPVRRIQGPQSALTDFLASHNINANQIRLSADRRRAAAEESLAAAASASAAASPAPAAEEEALPQPKKLRKQTAAQKAAETARRKEIEKIKASRRFQSARERGDSEVEGSDEDEAAARWLDAETARKTQFENCADCGTRFVVTGYALADSDGGLLCPKCSKKVADAENGRKRKRGQDGRINRRKIESEKLEGTNKRGAKDLTTMCLNALAVHIDEATDFGYISDRLVDRLAALLSKRRLIDSRTLDLFLKPETEKLTIYDAAKLNSDDFIRIFQLCPRLKELKLRNAIQFKGPVMAYLVNSPLVLTSLSLHGANLLEDAMWLEYFQKKGACLKELCVYYTDVSFGDTTLSCIAQHCPNLTKLKIEHNQQVTDAGLLHLTSLTKLEKLALDIYQPTSTAPYVAIINKLGSNLRTLSLSNIQKVSDLLLTSIHDNCHSLRKLRLKKNETFTDAAFTHLFTSWSNPPLEFIDLSECRHVDSLVPSDNPQSIGLCSAGFSALMSHSGRAVQKLNIMSCRHITNSTFLSVFDAAGTAAKATRTPGEEPVEAVLGKVYPKLESLDISFCWGVDDFVVKNIWGSCPAIQNVKVFGDFGVKGVGKVPKGKILLGCPNLRGMEIEGDESEEEVDVEDLDDKLQAFEAMMGGDGDAVMGGI